MMGYKLHCKVRTLQEAAPAEGRPRCGNCGKKLKPETSLRYLGDSPHIEGDMLLPVAYSPKSKPLPWKELLGIYLTHNRSAITRPEDPKFPHGGVVVEGREDVTTYYAHVTTGNWVGYSGGRETEVPFFCTQPCAYKFGCTMYAAGYRRKGIND